MEALSINSTLDGSNGNEETVFKLITEFLQSKKLFQTVNLLQQERKQKEKPEKESSEENTPQYEDLLVSLQNLKHSGAEENYPGGGKEEEKDSHGNEGTDPLPDQSGAIETANGKVFERKRASFSTFLETEEIEEIEYSDEEQAEEEVAHTHPDSQRSSREASRTSSILRPRSESAGSVRSSKSVSFITSSEEESESKKSDEWSDDEDPGYTRIPVEDFFQYTDEERDPKEDGYSFEVKEFDEQYVEGDKTEEDEWQQGAQPILRVTQQEHSSLGSSFTDGQPVNDSFGQEEELEVDKLNEILRDHIQIQRDEFYQESSQKKASTEDVPKEPKHSNRILNIQEIDEDVQSLSEVGEPEVKPSLESMETVQGKHPIQSFSDNSVLSEVSYESPLDDSFGPPFETFTLPIVHEKGRTGLEENKDFPITVGAIIAGRYQILQYIGQAAFSKAVRALNIHTNQQVCIKIIKNNKEFFDQSLDEIKLLKYINYQGNPDEKNVLQLLDYFYHKEHLFIVCELLRDNLYEFYKYNRSSGEEFYFTIERLKKIARQCLIALQFIHSLNLIHCDLKPENILVKSYSRCEVKIIDFGSSCFTGDHLSYYVQSRSYRAPEVILGLPYSQKIDIWSLGCILAELWTGKVLFHNESIPTLLARVVGILGPFDDDMLRQGKCAHKYFTKNHTLIDKREGEPGFICIKPKRTSLKSRLKCDDQVFVDFIQTLLTLRPEKRPSAGEALQHPFLC